MKRASARNSRTVTMMMEVKFFRLLFGLACICSFFSCGIEPRDNIFDSKNPEYIGDDSTEFVRKYLNHCTQGNACLAEAHKVRDSLFQIQPLNFSFGDTLYSNQITIKGKLIATDGLDSFTINGKSPIQTDNGWVYQGYLNPPQDTIWIFAIDTLGRPFEEPLVFYVNENSAKDFTGPSWEVERPIKGSILPITDSLSITLTVKDRTGVKEVKVNGVHAKLTPSKEYSVRFKLNLNRPSNRVLMEFPIVCTDSTGNRTEGSISYTFDPNLPR